VASSIDICNLALAHIGDEATVSAISPPDGSVQAMHCQRFYPIARDALLEMHDWNFARRHVALQETENTANERWAYQYAYPNNCARLLSVLPEDGDESKPRPYMQGSDSDGNKVIWTDEENAVALYTHAITDTTKFPGLFVNALSYLLASYLAGPITKSTSLKEGMLKMFKLELGSAGMANANANANKPVHTPDFMAVRGYVNPFMVDGKIVR
jgi:hypothetical protein